MSRGRVVAAATVALGVAGVSVGFGDQSYAANALHLKKRVTKEGPHTAHGSDSPARESWFWNQNHAYTAVNGFDGDDATAKESFGKRLAEALINEAVQVERNRNTLTRARASKAMSSTRIGLARNRVHKVCLDNHPKYEQKNLTNLGLLAKHGQIQWSEYSGKWDTVDYKPVEFTDEKVYKAVPMPGNITKMPPRAWADLPEYPVGVHGKLTGELYNLVSGNEELSNWKWRVDNEDQEFHFKHVTWEGADIGANTDASSKKLRTLKNAGIQFDERGRPLNPYGRTGISGRGLLGRWGANQAADPIVTRWVFDKSLGARVLQMLAIKRRDTGDWAIPGGMVEPGDSVSATCKKEFTEEAGNLEEGSEEKKLFEELTNKLFQQDEVVYRGYVDDPRNTDNAWMETVAMHYHMDDRMGVLMPHAAGDDAAETAWLTVYPPQYADARYAGDGTQKPLYASHKSMVDKAVRRLLDGKVSNFFRELNEDWQTMRKAEVEDRATQREKRLQDFGGAQSGLRIEVEGLETSQYSHLNGMKGTLKGEQKHDDMGKAFWDVDFEQPQGIVKIREANMVPISKPFWEELKHLQVGQLVQVDGFTKPWYRHLNGLMWTIMKSLKASNDKLMWRVYFARTREVYDISEDKLVKYEAEPKPLDKDSMVMVTGGVYKEYATKMVANGKDCQLVAKAISNEDSDDWLVPVRCGSADKTFRVSKRDLVPVHTMGIATFPWGGPQPDMRVEVARLKKSKFAHLNGKQGKLVKLDDKSSEIVGKAVWEVEFDGQVDTVKVPLDKMTYTQLEDSWYSYLKKEDLPSEHYEGGFPASSANHSRPSEVSMAKA